MIWNFKSVDTCLLSPINIAHKGMYVHVIKITLTDYIMWLDFWKRTKMSHKPIKVKDDQACDFEGVIHQS